MSSLSLVYPHSTAWMVYFRFSQRARIFTKGTDYDLTDIAGEDLSTW